MDETKSVIPLYMSKPNLLSHYANVTKIEICEINKKKYLCVQLDETIFHPKGGGQPCDEGTINGISVVYVHKELLDKNRIDEFKILHCFLENQELNFKIADQVELVVDPVKRKLYSRMHTAGHVLAEVVRMVFPTLEPYHGNHDPNAGYVRFKMLEEAEYIPEEIKQKTQPHLDTWTHKNLPIIETKLPSGLRAIQFSHYTMACGGTHVNCLDEIGNVEITDISINKKEKTVTIKYCLL